jgi:hypothetical protein
MGRVLVVIVASGCATTNQKSRQNPANGCSVIDSLIKKNGTPGVQFANSCDTCIAVAFEFRHQISNSQWTACYVPPHAKVVFWDADEYWLITRKPCKEARRNGLGGIPADVLESNIQTGRCDTLGEATSGIIPLR